MLKIYIVSISNFSFSWAECALMDKSFVWLLIQRNVYFCKLLLAKCKHISKICHCMEMG